MKKRGCRKNCRMKIVLSLAITASMTAALLMGCSGAGGKRDASDQAGQTSSESVSAMPGTEQTISGSSAAESASAVSGTEQAGPDNSAAESVIASKEKSLPMDTETASEAVVYGDERADLYLPLLEGKRTAVFSNQTGIVGNAIIEEDPAESAAEDLPTDTGINAESESDKGEDMEGGEIYVKKIPSMNICDIATAVDENAEQVEIGIRPGEKLHEQMIGVEDAHFTYEYPEHFKILPQICNWGPFDAMIKGECVKAVICCNEDLKEHE